MRFLKSKTFLVCVAVVVVLALTTALLSALGITGPIRSVLKTVAKPFEWCGSQVARAVNGVVDVFADYDRLKAENEQLRGELESLRENMYDGEVLHEENQWLREYLNLATTHPEFQLVDAQIIARESDNYSTVLSLNRGRVHGIKKNMPVITQEGVFGYVKELGLDWCKVVSIVETASSVGAYTDRAGVTGVVEGDADLRDGGRCRMTYIENTADLRIGDKVYTGGGSGSLYPPGLLIGEIVSIEADESTRSLIAEIQPSIDFTNLGSLNRVMVICGYATGG
ncbi:MAG: rod shape-determining protein MreC [Clostridia bacterium]|nr:rod shape-determining protein MreC [Clostridia bacterium]